MIKDSLIVDLDKNVKSTTNFDCMKTNRLHGVCQYTISAAVILIAGLVVFFPNNVLGFKLLDYNVHLMIGLLLLGYGALAIDYKKVMITSLGACMVLCMFLKSTSNDIMIMPAINTEPQLSVAHFNVSNIQDLEHLTNTFKDVDVDVLSFQELTPDWNYILQEKLKEQYPYNMSIVRIDPYGMAFYSKIEFNSMDTFLFENKPNLEAEVTVDNQKITLFSSYLMPNISKSNSEITKEHLDMISFKIRDKESPVIALGDYNMVYWANAISRFRDKAQVFHSRRDVSEDVLKPPYDHIFFSTDMECTKFQNLTDLEENHIGIMGVYQLKSLDTEDEFLPTALSSVSFKQ